MRVLVLTALLWRLLCSVDGFARMRSTKGSLRFAPRVSLSEQAVNMAEDKVSSGKDSDKQDNAPVYQGSGVRVYKPRGATPAGSRSGERSYQPRNRREGGGGTGGASYKGRGSGSYTPRGSTNSDREGGYRRGNGAPPLVLDAPMLLVHYKVPREKTEFKEMLEGRQDEFASAGFGGGGDWGGGGGDDFLKSFSPGGFKKGKGKGGGKDGERKGSEGAKPKAGESSRKFGGTRDEDYDNPDEEYNDEEEDEDYYGDEASLSLSPASLQAHYVT